MQACSLMQSAAVHRARHVAVAGRPLRRWQHALGRAQGDPAGLRQAIRSSRVHALEERARTVEALKPRKVPLLNASMTSLGALRGSTPTSPKTGPSWARTVDAAATTAARTSTQARAIVLDHHDLFRGRRRRRRKVVPAAECGLLAMMGGDGTPWCAHGPDSTTAQREAGGRARAKWARARRGAAAGQRTSRRPQLRAARAA